MNQDYNQLISLGAIVAMLGFILSGPVAFGVVYIVSPQPAWVSPLIFADNYSTLQDLPFYFGFILIGGMLMLVAGHYLNYQGSNSKKKFHLLLAFAWTIIFAALISFNYICQTTYVHNLALHYRGEYDTAIATFSMSNPLSICWATEMWGYAFLGIATWLMSEYYENKSPLIRAMLITNGIVSLISCVLTIIDVGWVTTLPGLIAYFIWNILMIVLMIAIYFRPKKRIHVNYTAVYRNTIYN